MDAPMSNRAHSTNLMRRLLNLCSRANIDLLSVGTAESVNLVRRLKAKDKLDEGLVRPVIDNALLVHVSYTPLHDGEERELYHYDVERALEEAIRLSVP